MLEAFVIKITKLQWKFESCVLLRSFLGVVVQDSCCGNTDDSQTSSHRPLWPFVHFMTSQGEFLNVIVLPVMY